MSEAKKRKGSNRSNTDNDAESGGARAPKTFRGLQENASGDHLRNIFLATRHLVARMQEMVYGDQDKEPFTLAREELSLKGVTGLALHAMYMRLIKDYEKSLAVEIEDDRFQPTLLRDLVKDLYNMDQELKRTKRQRIEEKADQKQQEATLLVARNEEEEGAISTVLQHLSKEPTAKCNSAILCVTLPMSPSCSAQSAPPSTAESVPPSSTEPASLNGHSNSQKNNPFAITEYAEVFLKNHSDTRAQTIETRFSEIGVGVLSRTDW
ncbi:hypothetical protein EDD11_002427 [Mortierella claussenii]|nr:hypothetical protein EDD11_002427 [Mortierella claussenii]